MPPDSVIAAVSVTAIVAIIAGCLHSMMKMYVQRGGGGASISRADLKEIRDGLGQLQQAVDAMAIEVERLSEGQRFTTKLFADHAREVAQISPSVHEG